jgi:tRNA (adenine37-N6)-methyltransferase
MVRENEIRAAERAVVPPPATDAGLVFIGRIHTPWVSRMVTPRQGRHDGPTCRIEVFEPWVAALDGLAQFERVEVLYWLHLSRRDLVLQSPANDGTVRGTFSLRTPARPNPIGTAIARFDRYRRRHRPGTRPRLPRRYTVARPEAGPDAVHPNRTAAGRGLSGR